MDWPDLESWDRRDEMETRGSDIPKSFFFFKLQALNCDFQARISRARAKKSKGCEREVRGFRAANSGHAILNENL
jgi:hypothetical protein